MSDAPNAGSALLVTLRWGAATWPAYNDGDEPEGGVVRYTTRRAPIVLGAETFAPLDDVEYTPPVEHGGVEPLDATLTMPAHVEPWRGVTRRAHPPIGAVIERIDPADEGTREVVFVGRVESTERRRLPGARVRCRLLSRREGLRMPLGIIVEPWCNNTLGDHVCLVELAAYTIAATVTVEGTRLTSATFNTTPEINGKTMPADWARFGRAVRGGLVIDVVDHDGETITLDREPPESWEGASIGVVVGCNKGHAACADVFGNLERFTGIGVGVPDHSPLLGEGP